MRLTIKSATELEDTANMYRGFLKSWKAISMFLTLDSKLTEKWTREDLDRYIKRCLTMEGFSNQSCELICDRIAKFD